MADEREHGGDIPEELFDSADLDRYQRVVDRLAIPYKVDGRGRVTATSIPSSPLSAADGLVSTVRDLARFEAAVDSALLDSSADSGFLLRPETLAVAWSPVAVRDGGTDNDVIAAGNGWLAEMDAGVRQRFIHGRLGNSP